MKKKKNRFIGIGAASLSILVLLLTFNTTFAQVGKALPVEVNDNIGTEDYSLFLQFRDKKYEEMTVRDFRSAALNVCEQDEDTFLSKFKQAVNDPTLKASLGDDSDADFLLNVFLPLNSEKWETRYIAFAAVQNGIMSECELKYEILDPDKITVQEFKEKIKGTISDFNQKLKGMETHALADVREQAAQVSSQHASTDLKLTIDVLGVQEYSGEQDTPPLPLDDQIIKELLPTGYAEMSIESYQKFLSDKINADESIMRAFENMDNTAIGERDDLFTITATINELTVKHQKQFGAPKDLPFVSYTFLDNSTDSQGKITSNTTMEFLIYYKVEDETATTVKERNEGLQSTIANLEKVITDGKSDDGTFDRQETEAAIAKIDYDRSSKINFKVELLNFQSEKSKE